MQLGNWEPAVPADVWSKLEHSLGHTQHKWPVAWWWAAGAAAALLIGVGVLKMNSPAVQEVVLPVVANSTDEAGNKKLENHNNGVKDNAALSNETEQKELVPSAQDIAKMESTNRSGVQASTPIIKRGFLSNEPLNNKNILAQNGSETQYQAEYNNLQLGVNPLWLQDLKVPEPEMNEPINPNAQDYVNSLLAYNLGLSDAAAFPTDKKLNKKAGKGVNSDYIYGLSIGQMRTSLLQTASNNPYVHRDYTSIEKNTKGATASWDFEAWVGKKISAKGVYATIGLRIGQQGVSKNYDFERVPVGTDGTQATDKFGYFPIVQYVPFFKAQKQFSISQKTLAIDMPIGILTKRNINKSWSFTAGATINPSFVLSTTGQSLSYNTLDPTDINGNWYRKVMLGAGAQLGINRNMAGGSLGLLVKGRGFPVNVYKVGSSIDQKPYDFGLSLQWIGGLTK